MRTNVLIVYVSFTLPISVGLSFVPHSAWAQEQDPTPVICEDYLLTERRATEVDWRALDRDERIALLVSQIVSLYASGIVPSQATLRELTAADAARVGWALPDLRALGQRAYDLYPDRAGSGLAKLIDMAGFRAKLPRPSPQPRSRPAPPPARPPLEVEPPPFTLAADALDVRPTELSVMSPDDRLTLVRRQVKALVDAELVRSGTDLEDLPIAAVHAQHLTISERSLRTLARQATLLIPAKRIDDVTVGGLAQLLIEFGLPFEDAVRARPTPPPAERAPARPVGAQEFPKAWLELRYVDFTRSLTIDLGPTLVNRYRGECRAIVKRLLDLGLAIDYAPESLAAFARAHDWTGTGLTAELVARLPERAAIGFHYMGGYLGLLKEFGVEIPHDVRLAMTATKQLSAAEYVPQARPVAAPAPVFERARAETPERLELIAIFAKLTVGGFDVDLPAIRQLTPGEAKALGAEALEERIKTHFGGGWRDWVERAGGDADEIVRAARRRAGR